MTLSQLQQQYQNQWLLVEVLREDEWQQPVDMRLLAHSVQRDEVYDALFKVPSGVHVATMFTGSVLQEGYAAAFVLWE